MPRRLRDGFWVLVFAAAGLAAGRSSAGTGNPSRIYKNEAMRVRAFEAPIGWEMAPQSSYPRLLASYSHRDGGKLTLSAQKVNAGTSALRLAEQSRPLLEKQGFTTIRIATDEDARVHLDAALDVGKRFVKQVYVVEANIGYVVTLIAPLTASARMTTDFAEAVRSLSLGSAEHSAPDDGGTSR